MSLKLPTTRLLSRLMFYEWAYGALEEADCDLGAIGEFVVGRHFDCLPKSRTLHAPVDLATKDGVTIEVKTTKATSLSRGCHSWDISDQALALKRRESKADVWIFLIADFAKKTKSPLSVNVFDEACWSCYVATGAQIVALGITNRLAETRLQKLGLSAMPLAKLGASALLRG